MAANSRPARSAKNQRGAGYAAFVWAFLGSRVEHGGDPGA